MHYETLEQWQHSHLFSVEPTKAEKNTQIVMIITAVTMVAEIVAGVLFGSVALLADGWHMATHVAAFGIAVFAYQYARDHATDPKYTFGTGKVNVLGGFTSAVVLSVVAFLIVLESIGRIVAPQSIQFDQAMAVAGFGLVINLVSAWLLDHDHHDQDQNLRAAYIHVLADALTSVLAIAALFCAKFLGWVWMDPLMGLIGAGVIGKWAYGLVCDTGAILLDGSVEKQIKLDVVTAIEANRDNRIADLHIWYIGQNQLGAILSVVTHDPQTPEYYKNLVSHIPGLAHVIVEVHQCQHEPCRELTPSSSPQGTL